MRARANENPVVQAALIGVLVIAFAFILFTRVLGGGGSSSEPAATDSAPAPTESSAAAPPADSAVPPTDTSAPAPTAPEATTPAPGGGQAPTGEMEAGEGLPAEVVQAYNAGDVVVLLVVDNDAIDDKRVKAAAKDLEGRSDVALFETSAKNVSDYSQITNGVAINRTPALIVLSPRKVSGDVPLATVDYGYRSLQSVNQAVEDAKYDGKNEPYYPE